MNKAKRKIIYNKFGGLCGYCEGEITISQMEVDHYWPKHLAHLQKGLDPDRLENLMPACKKCNRGKIGYRPEEWRSELGKQVSRLRKNAQFDRALRFGQIQITEKPIVFYFERLQRE